MYIKIRKIDNVIFDSQKTSFVLVDDIYYEVEYDYNFPSVQPYYLYKWDIINNTVILNDDESIELENRKTYSNLKIIKWIDDSIIKHKDFDFTLVLLKDEPIYYKGEKKIQNYLDPETNEIVVKKYYNEIIGDRLIYGVVSPNRIIGLEIKIVWYSFDNLVSSEKNQIVKNFNREEEGERRLKKRQRQISNLKGMAMGTAAEPIVDDIYTYYDEQVRFYINQGTSIFYDALINETNQTILYYLNILIPKTYDFELNISDYIINVNGLYRFSLQEDYYNYMIKYLKSGYILNVEWNFVLNEIEYIGIENNKFIFEIKDEYFIRDYTKIKLKWSNTIKYYIIHEIT